MHLFFLGEQLGGRNACDLYCTNRVRDTELFPYQLISIIFCIYGTDDCYPGYFCQFDTSYNYPERRTSVEKKSLSVAFRQTCGGIFFSLFLKLSFYFFFVPLTSCTLIPSLCIHPLLCSPFLWIKFKRKKKNEKKKSGGISSWKL